MDIIEAQSNRLVLPYLHDPPHKVLDIGTHEESAQSFVKAVWIDRPTCYENLNTIDGYWRSTPEHAIAVGGLLWQTTSTGMRAFPFYDGNGNICGYTDASGMVDTRYLYDGFLNVTQTGTTSYRYQASTKSWNPALELLEYQFRAYSPALGRWIQEDPIEEAGGRNLYGFVGNNSIMRQDYLGCTGSSWSIIDSTMAVANRLASIKFPHPPRSTNHHADWWDMVEIWFFERGGTPTRYSKVSDQSIDIANSYSMYEVREEYFKTHNTPKRWDFTGQGTATGKYGEVEWFIGSYEIINFKLRGQVATFEIKNKSGWHSATRLPKTWQNIIKRAIDVDIVDIVTDAPRGQVLKTKLLQRFPSINNYEWLRAQLDSLPSFGGDWNQEYEIEMVWCDPNE